MHFFKSYLEMSLFCQDMKNYEHFYKVWYDFGIISQNRDDYQ